MCMYVREYEFVCIFCVQTLLTLSNIYHIADAAANFPWISNLNFENNKKNNNNADIEVVLSLYTIYAGNIFLCYFYVEEKLFKWLSMLLHFYVVVFVRF